MEKEKILIVDGDKYIRDTLFDNLSTEYEVEASLSFKEALKMVRDKSYNIVIAEIASSEVRGIEVLRKLKELKSELSLIVVTTYKSVPLAVEAMKAGAYDYITKPFNVDELKLVILHALEKQRLVEEVKEKRVYEELALLDGLTHIYNRRYFDELLHRESNRATRYPQKFSLLMIDVDDFKKYNDTYGHLAGDEVLKVIAGILFHRTRVTDYVARYGGEEFAIITPHTDKKAASVLAARIMDYVTNQDIALNDSTKIRVTISIGIATFEEDAVTEKELIQRADEALYQAKKLGKNRICMIGGAA